MMVTATIRAIIVGSHAAINTGIFPSKPSENTIDEKDQIIKPDIMLAIMTYKPPPRRDGRKAKTAPKMARDINKKGCANLLKKYN